MSSLGSTTRRAPEPSPADPIHDRGHAASAPPGPGTDQTHELDLLGRIRAGDLEAIAEVYATHRPVALHVARRVCPPSDVDDVVSEAFLKVLDQIGRGGGPSVSFRAYLVTAVRSVSTDVARRRARMLVADVEELQRDAAAASDDVPHSTLRLESHLLTEALSSLPTRWQLVVWWSTVEGRSLTEVGDALGLNVNAAAALAFRAREGLRDAYLALHVERGAHPACRPWRDSLAALVRGRLAPTSAAATDAHLAGCSPCRDVLEQLRNLLVTSVPI